jgi:hypothetical protein
LLKRLFPHVVNFSNVLNFSIRFEFSIEVQDDLFKYIWNNNQIYAVLIFAHAFASCLACILVLPEKGDFGEIIFRFHYAGSYSSREAINCSKPLWASEDWSNTPSEEGGGCMARVWPSYSWSLYSLVLKSAGLNDRRIINQLWLLTTNTLHFFFRSITVSSDLMEITHDLWFWYSVHDT